MMRNLSKRGLGTATSLISALALVLGVSGCGGGGGGSEDVRNQPAPQTFNGLIFTLYTQGPAFTCIRSEGDATTGVETGAVEMTPASRSTTSVTANGVPSPLIPPTGISGARYTYQRTDPERGILTIEGGSNNVPVSGVVGAVNYMSGTFKRTYYLLFGTDGATITGINANDVGDVDDPDYLIPYPGLLWFEPTVRLVGGSGVPVGWTVEQSLGLNLPKIYPDGVNRQRFEITPDNLADPELGYQFLESTYTRFSNAAGDFLEEGVGNKDDASDPDQLIPINFDYQPDPKTTNLARIRIYDGANPVVVYDMTFIDFEKGTYVREDGSTGTFEFPFLDRTN